MSRLPSIPIPEWSPAGLAAYFTEHTNYAVVLTLIILNTVAVLYLVVSVVFRQGIKRREENRRTMLKGEVENLLSSFLSDTATEDLAATVIRGWNARSRRNEIIICQVFVNFFGMISGSARENLFRLYELSGTKERVIAGLSRRYNNPHTFLYIDLASKSNTAEAKQGLKSLLKHPEREIRFQALCSLVEVFRFNALAYIMEKQVEINEWEEMILMEKLLTLPSRGEIPMREYLASGNESLMRMTLRMARHFNRYDVEEELPVLLDHASPSLRQRVYEVAGTLLLNGLQDAFMEKYPSETPENQRTLLKSMASMGGNEALPFLTAIFQAKTPELSLLAAAAIFAISGQEGLRDRAGVEPQLIRICLHIEDPALV